MLYSDRFGPWFDLDGSEIIPLGIEAVEGRGTAHRCLPALAQPSQDRRHQRGDRLPLLTQLIRQDWERVMGGEDGQLSGKGFLIAYHSSAAAVGRLAEDLRCQVALERLLAASWPEGRVVGVENAVRSGALVTPRPGSAATIW